MNATVGFHSFKDLDFFRDALRGWDTEPTQLTSGELLVRWDQLVFDDMTISRLRTNLKIVDRTAYQAGHVGFVICLGAKTFCGQSVEAGSLVLFGPGREYRNLLSEDWESFEISMSSELFRSLSFASEVVRRIAIGPEHSVLPLSPHLISAFRSWSANFLAPFRSEPSLAGESYWTEAIREHTHRLLTQVFIENGCKTRPSKHVPGWSLAARAMDYVDHHENERLTTQQVSQAMGCTSRNIQIAFQKALGITPFQYALARRLHRARADLLLPTKGASIVTRTATQHGFLNFGRFSYHYRRLFGELPTDTVARARKRIIS